MFTVPRVVRPVSCLLPQRAASAKPGGRRRMLPLAIAAVLGLGGAVQAQAQAVTYTVTSSADSSTAIALNCLPGVTTGTTCRLRDAVAASNALLVGTPTIAFSSALTGTRANPTVITLAGTQLELSKSVTITGPGADLLSISGHKASRILQVDSGVTANLSGITFKDGAVPGNNTNGGAIYNSGILSLVDSQVTNGQSGAQGGGIYVASGSATITRVALFGNSARQGAAIASAVPITVIDCTFAANSSNVGGSGIFLAATGALNLNRSTIVGNSTTFGGFGDAGGGIETSNAPAVLTNSIVAGNSADGNPDVDGNYTDNGGNLVGTSAGPTSNVDPLLAPLGYHGGHTQTMPPLPGSPAICLGVQSGTLPATDQRGYPSTTTYGNITCIDAGSVQTKYFLAVTGPASIVSGQTLQPAQAPVSEIGGPLLPLGSTQSLTTPSSATLSVANGTLTGSNTSNTIDGSSNAYLFNVKLTTTASSDTLIATLPLTATGVTPAVVLTATGTPFTVVQPVATTLTDSASPTTGVSTAGGRSILTATVLDQNGQPFAGTTVHATTSGSAVLSAASATTNSAGQATFTLTDNVAESATTTFTTGSLSKQATVTFAAPVTYTVLNNQDTSTGTCVMNAGPGNCTLRNAVAANNAAGGGNTINFAVTLNPSIVLSGTQLELSSNVTITGPGATVLSVSGNNVSRVFQIDAGVTAGISGLTLTLGNGIGSLSNGNGGAIYSAGNLTLSAVAITANTANNGGGIDQESPGSLTLTASTVSGNASNTSIRAISGGGGGLFCGSSCVLSLDTFANNTTSNGGGAIAADQAGFVVTLSGVTISGNYAAGTGGISGYAPGSFRVSNSIIAGNSSNNGNPDAISFIDLGGNLTSVVGNSLAPKLAPLGYYGGSTQTMPPLPGSPALCIGTQANLAAVSPGLTDQRGAKHSAAYCTQGSQVDAGAVQTSYSSVRFVQQPTNVAVNSNIAPAPTVTLTENGHNSIGTPIAIALQIAGDTAPNGQPTLAGTTPQTTQANGLASFGDLKLSKNAGNLALIASAAITSSYTLAATSTPFDAYNTTGGSSFFNTVTDNVGSRPFPGAVVTLVATTTNLGGATYSPTLTVTLPAGLSLTSIPASNYPYGQCFPTSSTTVTCSPMGNTSGFFNPGASESVTIQATVNATDAIGLTLPVTLTTSDPQNDPGNNATDTLIVSAITVNTLADDATGTAGNCSGGTCTLRDAIAVVNAAGSGTTPTIAFGPALAGTQAAPNTITLTNGQLELSHSAIITGPGADLLSLSGNNTSRVLQNDVGSTSTISGLTFTKGNGSGSQNSGAGGAILNVGTLALVDSTVSSSNAVDGGGIQSLDNSMTLTRVTITGNSASDAGGGVCSGGAVTVTSSTVTNNTAVQGAGLFLQGTVSLNNSTITANIASRSLGGVDFPDYGVSVTDSVIAGNSSPNTADTFGSFTDNGGNVIGTAASGTSSYTAAQLNFAPLGFYGGHTMTLPALPGSVALCAGVSTAGNGYTLPATDQRSTGFARSTNYTGGTPCVDSGAFQTHYALSFSAAGADIFSGEAFPAAVKLTESGNTLPGVTASTTQNTLGFTPLDLEVHGSISGNTSTGLSAGAYTFNPTIFSSVRAPGLLTSTLPLTGSISIAAPALRITVEQPTLSLTASTVVPNPNSVAIGGTSNVTITAIDASNGVAIQGLIANLTGTGAPTITAVSATTNSNGQAFFTVTDATLQTVTLTATLDNGSYTATLSSHPTITFTAGPTAAFKVSGFPNPDPVSAAGSINVTAQDSAGNTMTGFTGTVTLTSTDPAATLPGSYTFTPADMGVHTFNLTLNTAGTQSITATTGSGSSAITGSETAIFVTGSVWIVNSNGTVSRLNSAGTVLATTTNNNAAGTLGGIAIDNAGDAWAVTNRTNSVTEAAPNGTLTGTFTGAGINTPAAVAIDGLGMVWVANGNNSVSVLSPNGAAISPSTGYQSTTLSLPSAIAIDQTGSVWITNSGSTTVTRIFGAAAPVVTPLVTGTTNTTQGARP